MRFLTLLVVSAVLCSCAMRVSSPAALTDRTFTTRVDLSERVVDYVDHGGYDAAHAVLVDVHVDRLVARSDRVVQKLECFLIYRARSDGLRPDAIIDLIEQRGARPADVRELLAFSNQHRGTRRLGPVFALGQPDMDDGTYVMLPYIAEYDGESKLTFQPVASDGGSVDGYFLAVRDPPASD